MPGASPYVTIGRALFRFFRARGLLVNPVAVWAVKSPVRLARRIYGPFNAGSIAFDVEMDDPGVDDPVPPARETLGVLVERIANARAVVLVGALSLTVELTLIGRWRWAWLGEWAYVTLTKGLILMAVAPLVVFGVVAGLVLAARPGVRRVRLRRSARAIGTAALTLLVLVALWALAQNLTESSLDPFRAWFSALGEEQPLVAALLAFVILVALVWPMIFVLATIYLVAQNGLDRDRSLPLLPPLVSTCVVWIYLVLTVSTGLEPAHLAGWREVVERYGPPVVVTAFAVVEIGLLRRDHRIGFRGPVPRM